MSEPRPSNMIQLTGLWIKEGKKGTFLAGNLSSRASLLVFKNNSKQKESDPDYFVCLAPNEPKEKKEKEKDSGVGF